MAGSAVSSDRSKALNDLLLHSAVCGAGLDTVPLPGDVSKEELAVAWFSPSDALAEMAFQEDVDVSEAHWSGKLEGLPVVSDSAVA